MKQQTLNRLANTGLESVTARNLAKLVDELGYKLVDEKSCLRGQADIERDILQAELIKQDAKVCRFCIKDQKPVPA